MTIITQPKMEFTQDQKQAQEAIVNFVQNGSNKLLTIGGYAGTGKTTTLAESVSILRQMKKFKDLKIAFVCFTGKASTVLRDKLARAGAIKDREYCGTIHGLIYRPVMDQNDRVIDWRKVDKLEEQIIIIDEASMVGETIFEDLKSYGIPIIAVGDHGQLPPIMSKLNLMENPMVKLEKIHRQAEGNPIIFWSMKARNGDPIPFERLEGDGGEFVEKTSDTYNVIIRNTFRSPLIETFPMILCGVNRTRVSVNQLVREIRGYSGMPKKGERVICLKNNRRQKIFNGMSGEIESIDPTNNQDFYKARIKFDIADFKWSGEIFAHQFEREYPLRGWKNFNSKVDYTEMEIGNLFDYGYAITVHKSQGSQAEAVVLIEEKYNGLGEENFRRWLYTGITRASKNLIIVARR